MILFGNQTNSIWRTAQVSLVTIVLGAWLYSTIFRESITEDVIYAFSVVTLTQLLIAAGRYGWMRYATRSSRGHRATEIVRPAWQWSAAWVILCVIVGYFLGVHLGNMIIGDPEVALTMTTRTRMVSLSIATGLIPAMFVTFYYYSVSRISRIELQAQTALRSAVESQLKLLESQLEPHMLFNTLANLRVLMIDDPRRAQGMLDRLIGYLRGTLSASRAKMHPLHSEFDRILDYLELMAIRMGSRLHFEIALPPALSDAPCPPFLLQPLVENAIKHGLEPQVQGGRIYVTAKLEGRVMILRVRDTGAGLSGASTEGTHFGMKQVRERLAALYGSRASVVLAPAADAEGGAVATVSIPMPSASSASVTLKGTP